MASKKPTPKKSEEIIHIKLEYDEARQGKQEILNSQAHLLKIMMHIQNYKKLRDEEIKKKGQISKKIKATKAGINKLNLILPKYKKPEILMKEEEKEAAKKETPAPKKPKKSYSPSVTSQLEEIQRKIEALQRG